MFTTLNSISALCADPVTEFGLVALTVICAGRRIHLVVIELAWREANFIIEYRPAAGSYLVRESQAEKFERFVNSPPSS